MKVDWRNDIWNWIASTHLLFRLYFVLLNVEDDTWLITESLVISLSTMWTAVKSIFVGLLTKSGDYRPIIGAPLLLALVYQSAPTWGWRDSDTHQCQQQYQRWWSHSDVTWHRATSRLHVAQNSPIVSSTVEDQRCTSCRAHWRYVIRDSRSPVHGGAVNNSNTFTLRK